MSNDGKGFENENYFSDYRRKIENSEPRNLIAISLNILFSNLTVFIQKKAILTTIWRNTITNIELRSKNTLIN